VQAGSDDLDELSVGSHEMVRELREHLIHGALPALAAPL